jgi:hypothetical protein
LSERKGKILEGEREGRRILVGSFLIIKCKLSYYGGLLDKPEGVVYKRC